MSVCRECCVLSGRSLCEELITRPEESYRLWCVFVCDQETSWIRRPGPTRGCRTSGGGLTNITTCKERNWIQNYMKPILKCANFLMLKDINYVVFAFALFVGNVHICLINYLDISMFMQYLATMTFLILIMFRNCCYPLIFITFLPCLWIFKYFVPLMAHYTSCLIYTFPRQ